jgi:AcrR family transcriptional regulator
VAKLAGVSHAAPYRHFESKDALLAALGEQGFRDLGDALRAAKGKDPVSAFQAQGVGYVRFALAHPGQVRVMFRSGLVQGDYPGLKAAADEAFALLVRGVVACQDAGDFPEGDPIPLASTCWALGHGIALLVLDRAMGFDVGDDAAVERFTRQALGRLLRGMKQSRADSKSRR